MINRKQNKSPRQRQLPKLRWSQINHWPQMKHRNKIQSKKIHSPQIDSMRWESLKESMNSLQIVSTKNRNQRVSPLILLLLTTKRLDTSQPKRPLNLSMPLIPRKIFWIKFRKCLNRMFQTIMRRSRLSKKRMVKTKTHKWLLKLFHQKYLLSPIWMSNLLKRNKLKPQIRQSYNPQRHRKRIGG